MRTTDPVRIAHAYGNTRDAIEKATRAPVDLIEADAWYRRGRVFIHHDRHLRPFPLLADRRMRGHPRPPWSLPLPRGYYIRPDFNILTLEDLLDSTRGKRGLLLDVKGKDDDTYGRRFARYLAKALRESGGDVQVCGQTWAVLAHLREIAPEVHVRFSIECPDQWRAFLQMTEREDAMPDVCIQHRFLTAERLDVLKAAGAGIYAWTVDDPAEADALLDRGVDGIISNNLSLLAALRRGGS